MGYDQITGRNVCGNLALSFKPQETFKVSFLSRQGTKKSKSKCLETECGTGL